ncbi:hypothetical protein [Ralstonia pickettii]|uniref:Secreted protein n=1 Tax=Ralstonia pickettii TaxID=329 RepID=A0AAW4Q7K0_RALPI|nr:hypothetical protein [Ralstonia pickettii]MBX3755154.1 hypothetical protein [Ralstonia pickettii]MBX3784037.1 hypothetical protein [Ralstonia pickettii]MBX3789813.1 hypothetical protein [Ralstonia pickettii]MBX3793620.1 hypothetical protein [Ralstonia pickettii]MBX3876167.1 hypothetical protein [Ralstonia pickettii]
MLFVDFLLAAQLCYHCTGASPTVKLALGQPVDQPIEYNPGHLAVPIHECAKNVGDNWLGLTGSPDH